MNTFDETARNGLRERRRARWAPRAAATFVLGLAVVAAVLYARVENAALFDALRHRLFDHYLWHLEDTRSISPDVVVIDIDDASVERIGPWPWPRAQLAKIMATAAGAGAKAVAFDMSFTEPDRLSPGALTRYIQEYDPKVAAAVAALPDADSLFADWLAKAPAVLGAVAAPDRRPFVGAAAPQAPPGPFAIGGDSATVRLPSQPRLIRNLPALEAAATGFGVVDMAPSPDGVVRRMPLVFKVGETLYPSLALVAVQAYLGADSLMLTPTEQGRVRSITVGEKAVQTDGVGALWAPFARKSYAVEPAYRLLSGETAAERLKDKLLIVGATAAGTAPALDLGLGGLAPRAYLHGATAAAILAGDGVYRPDFLAGAEIMTAAAAAALFLAAAVYRRRLLAAVVLLGAPAAAFAYSRSAFVDDRVLVDPTLIVVVLASALLYWAAFRLAADRVALLYERSFVGRIVGLMSEGFVVTDKAGEIVSANRTAERLMTDGLTPPIARLLPETGALTRAAAPERQVAARRARQAVDDHAPPAFLEVESARIDDRGRQLAVHVMRDISKLKQAEDAAAMAAERLTLATESMADGLVLFDRDGGIDFHNRAIATIARRDADGSLSDRTYDSFVAGLFAASKDDGPSTYRERLALLQNTPELEDERQTGAGGWLLVRERATPNGGLVGVYTDITAIKQVEAALRDARWQAEAANNAKNRFLATVSHELRTPLNAILGFSDAIKEEMFGPLENERYAEYMGYIHESGAELLNLVEDLLDVASAEAAEFPIDMGATDVTALIAALMQTFQPQLQAADITADIDIADPMPPCLLDPRATRRVLANLISNALKYGGDGVTLDVVARHSAGAAGGHSIEVRDDGVGMSQDQVARAFEPFWQGQTTENAPTAGGMGLGLPLVKTLVERQGGRIEIKSAPSAGTAIKLFFPNDRSKD